MTITSPIHDKTKPLLPSLNRSKPFRNTTALTLVELSAVRIIQYTHPLGYPTGYPCRWSHAYDPVFLTLWQFSWIFIRILIQIPACGCPCGRSLSNHPFHEQVHRTIVCFTLFFLTLSIQIFILFSKLYNHLKMVRSKVPKVLIKTNMKNSSALMKGLARRGRAHSCLRRRQARHGEVSVSMRSATRFSQRRCNVPSPIAVLCCTETHLYLHTIGVNVATAQRPRRTAGLLRPPSTSSANPIHFIGCRSPLIGSLGASYTATDLFWGIYTTDHFGDTIKR